ncbi:hypothetical protein HYH02_009324 [Chlamydomonas schloesseri]|uniref:Uncharacterized protein n=1 Tax=Chlamydomonas schloesseri TaxID=2026947 RepID=A0A835TFP6_9CHLO|nr:hypothetical protein HYH02_009324 [Chlamydomonas schloesseri]|eukprot:KAG2443251.1 hypothetical protein HYH02_009324 [Chlamydomonas schloesseri]
MSVTATDSGAFQDSLEGTAAYNNIVPFPIPGQLQEPGRPAGANATPQPNANAQPTHAPARYARFAVGPVWGPAWIPAKLPGPTAAESSGLDFIDLFDMPLPEVQARVGDAATFRMLGCTDGALARVPAAATGSPAAPAPVNINALTRFRNAWIRNVSPIVAVSVRDAMIADRAEKKRKAQALLESQKAACAALGSGASSPASPASSPPASPSSKTGAGGRAAGVRCRFVAAATAAGEQQQAAAACGSSSQSASSASPAEAGGGAVGASAESEQQQQQQQQASSPPAHVGAPSSCTVADAEDQLDASQLPQLQRSSPGASGGGGGGDCARRRRGSRGRGLERAGRQPQGGQQQGGAAWI